MLVQVRLSVLLIGCVFALMLMAQPSAAQQPFVINSSYSPPLSSADNTGFFDLLLKEAFSRIGHEARTQLRPAQRSLVDADQGLADGDVGRVEGIDLVFPNLVRVPEPVLDERQFVAFGRKDRVPATISWGDLREFRVGFVNGWKIFDLNTGSARDRLPVVTTKHLFQVLQAGHIDLALSARLDGLDMARQLGITDIVVLDPPLAVKKMYLYLNKKHASLAAPLAKELKAMKREGYYARLLESIESASSPGRGM